MPQTNCSTLYFWQLNLWGLAQQGFAGWKLKKVKLATQESSEGWREGISEPNSYLPAYP